MTLRKKSVLSVILCLVVALAALVVVSDRVVLGSFKRLEEKMAVESAARARAALDDEVEQLKVKITDWSSWDDMYRFALDRNEAFIKANMPVETFVRMNLAAIVVFGTDGNTVWEGLVNPAHDALETPPGELIAVLHRASQQHPTGSASGLLRLSDRAYLFSSEPILTSDGTGDPHGHLAFVREVNAGTMSRIGRLGAFKATAYRVGDPAMPDDMTTASAAILASGGTEVRALDDAQVSAFTVVNDAEGSPALVLRIDTPRSVYQHGVASVRVAAAVLAVLGTSFGTIVLVLIGKLVLHRILMLNREVKRIGDSRRFSDRVSDRGDDEISDLAHAINAMLTELEHARAQADAANHAKSRFLADMSHEIRTPMTAILGFADLLDDPALTEQTRAEHLRTIRASGLHLMSVINDVLDLSKIEAGKITVERLNFDPSRVLADVLRMMAPRAATKGVALEVVFDSPLPASVESDPTRLQQILVNVVGNAIKFCDRGSVRVRARHELRGDLPVLVFDVRDTGIGMDQAQLASLFKPFNQADASTTRRFGGTGLGLAISRQLATLLGGNISVQSTPGAGSTFTITIQSGAVQGAATVDRFDPAAAAPSAPAAEARLSGRILLAEDGPDNQRLVAFFLRKAGAHVEIVGDGRQAVDLALDAQSQGRAFDLVLMDVQMPVLDGHEATRQLRARGFTAPIIALTAHAMTEDRAKCLAAGCDDFASKPIDRISLIAACATWIERGRSQTGAAQAA